MSDELTNSVADYVSTKAINISALSRSTGISEGILRRSLCSRERSLRAQEFISICCFLDVDPLVFRKY